MKLSIIRNSLVYKVNGHYYSSDTFLHFVKFWAPYFKSILLIVGMKELDDPSELDRFNLKKPLDLPDNMILYEMKHFQATVIGYYKNLFSLIKDNLVEYREIFAKSDVLLLMVPSIVSMVSYFVLRSTGVPIISYVIGDQVEIIKHGSKYKGLMNLFALAVSRAHEFVHKRIINNSRAVFYVGSDLEKKYPFSGEFAYKTFSSVILEEDIVSRSSFLDKGPVRLLYLGRIAHEKGLQYLVDSIRILKEQMDIEVELTLCGMGPETQNLKNRVSVLGIEGSVHFRGFIGHGVQLDLIFAENDIFVLPSLSEGIPKVLLEAMAKGLPVIATNVGGIPDIIENHKNGLLVPSASAESLAQAVIELIDDKDKMIEISRQGNMFASEHTAIKHAKFISEAILNAIDSDMKS